MDKKSKILLLVIFGILLGSVEVVYQRFFIFTDFVIQGETSCDPSTEKCFIRNCQEEECGDPEVDREFYKLIRKNYRNSNCNPNNQECINISCGISGENCEHIYCDKDGLGEGRICSDPGSFLDQDQEPVI